MAFKISTGFAHYGVKDVDTFASHVFTQMTANAASFPGTTANVTALGVAQGNLHTAIAASLDGSHTLILERNNKCDIVVAILRALVNTIEAIPNITEAVAATSGFVTYKPSGRHDATTPDPPVILGIVNAGHGQLGFNLQGSNTRRGYELQSSINGAPPVHAGFFANTRNVVVTGLTAGTTYTFQARALGGNNQNSDWSAPVSCMCT